MYETREEAIQAEVEKSGYKVYILDGHGKCPNWYSHPFFLFGNYIGCNVQQANILAVLDRIGNANTNTLNPDYVDDMLNAMENFPVLILRVGYGAEEVIFNMPKLAENFPDFYDELIAISKYPVLDEEILDNVNQRRILEAWAYSVDDILKEAYKENVGKQWNNNAQQFCDWVDRVYERYGQDGLLETFRGFGPYTDGDMASDNDIEHETGYNVYFRTKDYKGNLTSSMLRLINITKLCNEEEIRVDIPVRK